MTRFWTSLKSWRGALLAACVLIVGGLMLYAFTNRAPGGNDTPAATVVSGSLVPGKATVGPTATVPGSDKVTPVSAAEAAKEIGTAAEALSKVQSVRILERLSMDVVRIYTQTTEIAVPDRSRLYAVRSGAPTYERVIIGKDKYERRGVDTWTKGVADTTFQGPAFIFTQGESMEAFKGRISDARLAGSEALGEEQADIYEYRYTGGSPEAKIMERV